MTLLHEAYALIGERQFYVGHGYNALQIVVGAYSTGDGESMVFYSNRTASDQVAGFLHGPASAMARRVMLREVVQLFTDIRATIAVKEEGLLFRRSNRRPSDVAIRIDPS